jgi:hypothetical protein
MDERSMVRASRVDVLVGVLVLGSLWGAAEVVLGSAMAAGGVPCRAGILTGAGIGLMGVALAAFKRPMVLLGVAVVAVLCKQLVVPILHVSVLCEANSSLAVLLDGAALGAVALLVGRRMEGRLPVRVGAGASSALLAACAFYFAGLRVAPCNYLNSFARPGGAMAFMVEQGLVWAAFAAVLLPAGYWVGTRAARSIPVLKARKPTAYGIASATVVVCCWAASALTIAAGA